MARTLLAKTLTMRFPALFALAVVAAATAASAACSSSAPTDTVVVYVLPDGGMVGGNDAGNGGPTTDSGKGGGPDGSHPTDGGTHPTDSGGPPPPGDAGGALGVPCDVATYLAQACTGCHSDPPITGALTGLVTYADLTKMAIEDPTKTEAQLSLGRMMNMPAPIMPPGGAPTAAQIAIIQNWVNAGTPMGAGCGGDGGPPPPPPPGVFGNDAGAFMPCQGGAAHNPGQDCFGCHTSSCTGGGDCGPSMVFGGTLYDGNGVGLAGAEVRFVDSTGAGTSVCTGSNGNFWKLGSTAFSGPAAVGVRNASGYQNMHTALQSTTQGPATTGGACNACHCTGTGCTIAKIHLP